MLKRRFGIHDEYFSYITQVLLEKNSISHNNIVTIQGSLYPNEEIICIFKPDIKDWLNQFNKKYHYQYINTIPCILITSHNNQVFYSNVYRQEIDTLIDARIINYSMSDFFSCKEHRSSLLLKTNRNTNQVNSFFRREYAKSLIIRLEKIKPGKEDYKHYENLVKDIFDFLFDENHGSGIPQDSIANGSYKVDINYYIEPYKTEMEAYDFWKKIRDETQSSYLYIECKNSIESSELKYAVSQIEQYFIATNINCGIITIRDKSSINKIKLYTKLIEKKSKFLLILDDSDLIQLLTPKHTNAVDIKEVNEPVIKRYYRNSGSALYELMAQARIKQ